MSGLRFSKIVDNSTIARPVDFAIVVGVSPSLLCKLLALILKPSSSIILWTEPYLPSKADAPTAISSSSGCSFSACRNL